jgi:hypothetical protein
MRGHGAVQHGLGPDRGRTVPPASGRRAAHLNRCTALAAACGGLLGAAALTGVGLAAMTGQPAPRGVDLLLQTGFSGEDFGGLRLGMPAQQGAIALSAHRARVWVQDPMPGVLAGTTLGGPVQRLLLEGDVRLNLGVRQFGAARAVVWIERLEPSPVRPGQIVHQVAVYLDRAGLPEAQPDVSVAGDRVLITAVIDGPLSLSADLLVPAHPDGGAADAIDEALGVDHTTGVSPATPAERALVQEGEERLARFLAELTRQPGSPPVDQSVAHRPITGISLNTVPWRAGSARPFEPLSRLNRAGTEALRARGESAVELAALDRARRRALLGLPVELETPRRLGTGALFAGRGLLSLAAGQVDVLSRGAGPESTPGATSVPEGPVVMATGGVSLQYTDATRDRSLLLTAERAVVFMEPGELTTLTRAPIERVRGFYLEGSVVATTGVYTVRGSRVYYDVRNNQALLLDAVFWTYDAARDLPLYLRADQLRQVAQNQFEGRRVRLATSAFFEPQLSLAASELTLTREPGSAGAPDRDVLQARGISARFEGLPFFWLPSFTGDGSRFPLRSVSFEGSSESGAGIRTRWDAFGLLQVDAPNAYRVDLLLDAYLRRGAGLGADSSWSTPDARGSVYVYLVPHDRGRDVLPSGVEVDRRGDVRGVALVSHVLNLNETWTVMFQATYESDPNFLNVYDRTTAETRRDTQSYAYLRAIDGNTQFDALIAGSTNTFVTPHALLQSQGYSVNRLPEVRYFRVADDLNAGGVPGLLSWSSEYRLSRMNLEFSRATARKLGFTTPALAGAALGLAPDQSPADVLPGAGFIDNPVTRLDTRHQFDSQVTLGPVILNPFGAARATFYDHRFDAFSTPANSRLRGWYGAGLSASTSIARIYDEARSDLLDIDRLRHIIEPSVTVFSSGATSSSSRLPIYDEDVEGLSEGTTVRAGIRQTLQTYRGGLGASRSVDMLTLTTDVVASTRDVDTRSPFGRFFDFQPERSQLGNSQVTELVWQVTDATAVNVSNTYDFDASQNARTVIGLAIQHSADFSTYSEVRFLNPRNVTYYTGAISLRLTSLYTSSAFATVDTNRGELQTLGVQVRREFPSLYAIVNLGYNRISDQFSVGLALRPLDVDRRALQLQRLNPTQLDAGLAEPASPAVLPGGL